MYADHLLQLRESKSSERLGEDVRELPNSFDELDDNLPPIDTVPEEVELYVDVFAPVVQNRILLLLLIMRPNKLKISYESCMHGCRHERDL